MTHQRHPKPFDAVIYMHSVSHCASLQVARRLDHVRMLEVLVTLGELVDEVQAMSW